MGPDKRDSLLHEPILPIVEESGENSRNDSGEGMSTTAFAKGRLPIPPAPTGPPPPTPPKSQPPPRPEGSDSGYGGNSNGTVSRDNSLKVRPRLSKESLNKSLPPLPQEEEKQGSGVRMVA